MTDYQGFIHGGVQFPLPVPGIGGIGATLLRDADPVTFYVLEYYKAVLQTHLGGRMLAEAASSGADQITTVVGDTLPLNPEPYLTQEHIHFPLLAAYRKSTKFVYIGSRKLSLDAFEVVYVLPPLQAGEAERLTPLLKAVVNIIDNRTEQGFDPSYTPTAPTGTAGDSPWTRAGLARAEVTAVSYGGYSGSHDLFFPAVAITLELEERNEPALSEFEDYNGVDAAIDVVDSIQETTVSNVSQIATYPAPTITLAAPATGSKAGGTSVTLTGTGFRVGTLPRVRFGNVAATAVNVVSATSITCVSPAHDAFPTFAADVEVENIDGQTDTLTAGFTFTTP